MSSTFSPHDFCDPETERHFTRPEWLASSGMPEMYTLDSAGLYGLHCDIGDQYAEMMTFKTIEDHDRFASYLLTMGYSEVKPK